MAEPGACLNCDQPYGSPPPRYCPSCGQETQLRPPTLREFAQQFGGAYISTEGALWRSLKLLLLKPGALTREYLDGRRRRYVLPLRLYLTISVLVLLALRWQTQVQIGSAMTPEPDGEPVRVQLQMLGGRAELKDGKFTCTDLPAWMCARLQRRLDKDPQLLASELTAFGERFVGNLGTAMFIAVPAFALLTLISFQRGLRYTEHLVFALHLHAFWFLMFGLTMLPGGGWVALPAMLAMPVYALLALRRVFGGHWAGLLLRAAAVAVAYGAVLLLTVGVLGLGLLLF
jgi:hypothetical protein